MDTGIKPAYTLGPLRTQRSSFGDGDVGVKETSGALVAEFYSAIRRDDERSDAEALANAQLFVNAGRMVTLLHRAVEAIDRPSEKGTLADLMAVSAAARVVLVEMFGEVEPAIAPPDMESDPDWIPV
jgi:hypothetical protein